jgi:hypothetical protein
MGDGVHLIAGLDTPSGEGAMTHGDQEWGRISELKVGDLLVREDIGTVEVTRLG